MSLSEEQVARFVVNQHRFIGAQVQARLQRHYPYAGELAHVLGYVGRINQKEEIATLNLNLNFKVERRTKELKKSIENLAEARHELDSFMYRASHDLRAPLVRLQGLSNLLKIMLAILLFLFFVGFL